MQAGQVADILLAMAKKLPPLTEEEVRAVYYQILRRVIFLGLALIAFGLLIIGAMALWG